MTAEQEREKLLKELRDAGVNSPATMYPKRDMWTTNSAPQDMFDRMRAHLIEIAQFKSAQALYD